MEDAGDAPRRCAAWPRERDGPERGGQPHDERLPARDLQLGVGELPSADVDARCLSSLAALRPELERADDEHAQVTQQLAKRAPLLLADTAQALAERVRDRAGAAAPSAPSRRASTPRSTTVATAMSPTCTKTATILGRKAARCSARSRTASTSCTVSSSSSPGIAGRRDGTISYGARRVTERLEEVPLQRPPDERAAHDDRAGSEQATRPRRCPGGRGRSRAPTR